MRRNAVAVAGNSTVSVWGGGSCKSGPMNRSNGFAKTRLGNGRLCRGRNSFSGLPDICSGMWLCACVRLWSHLVTGMSTLLLAFCFQALASSHEKNPHRIGGLVLAGLEERDKVWLTTSLNLMDVSICGDNDDWKPSTTIPKNRKRFVR